MNSRRSFVALALLALVAHMTLASSPAPSPYPYLPKLTTTASQMTVSGLSSGGYMAVQYHVAHSADLIGVGVLAGGPYYCAEDTAELALTTCMKAPDLIDTLKLIGFTDTFAIDTWIDATHHMANDRVWLYSGSEDTVVHPGVMEHLQTYYEHYISHHLVKTVFNISSEHAFPTTNYGNACGYLGAPYINNCGYNGAWEMMQWLFDNTLNEPVPANLSNLYQFDMDEYIPTPLSAKEAGMWPIGYAYVPKACVAGASEPAKSPCRIHVDFHGCEQSVQTIGMTYIEKIGMLEIAEANNIILVFPQTQSNAVSVYGCWNWWGFIADDPYYATKLGVQIKAVDALLKEAFLS